MEVLSELRAILQPSLARVDALLLSIAETQGGSALIPQINHYLQGAGGKRIRSLLTLAFAQMLGDDAHQDQVSLLAASVELIHTATLLHDDVIDESPTRRGKTTNQIWGNKTAILVGDYLFSHAFIFMVRAKDQPALELLSTTSSVIAEAEVRQLEVLNNPELSMESYLALIREKTAVLFAAATRCGAVVALDEAQSNAYDYGLNIGMVYQMVDDVLDYFAEDERFGKALYNDLKEAKMTLPLMLLRDCDAASLCLVRTLFAQDGVTEDRLIALRALFVQHDILSKCSKFIQGFVLGSKQSLADLAKVSPIANNEILHLLTLLPQALVGRSF